MKAFLSAATLVVAIGSSAALLAAQGDSAMQDCFSKHAQLMDKPAVKNARDCWRMHGYLMGRS